MNTVITEYCYNIILFLLVNQKGGADQGLGQSVRVWFIVFPLRHPWSYSFSGICSPVLVFHDILPGVVGVSKQRVSNRETLRKRRDARFFIFYLF